MCLILVAWNYHPRFPLIVISNRDEFYQRPTQIPHFWVDQATIYAGRDLQAEGTWLGVNRFKQFAAVTNYRDPSRLKTDVESRGQLTAQFLRNSQSLDDYIDHLKMKADQYNDFNLILCDQRQLVCFESKTKRSHALSPGIYGLSNHFLDTPWPKVTTSKEKLKNLLTNWALEIHTLNDLQIEQQHVNELSNILSDETIYPDAQLPETGMPLEIERRLSAAFIKSDDYGTRATTVVIANQTGDFLFYEKQYGINGLFEGETCRIVTHLEVN
ncbi:NRDE family protein [Ferrovum sp. PN-J185]|uniref:NRDE family protein n=1 Tax=Ferrovum sp. PN-J185 TaxID=1356306 RepID=UPI000799DB69|nr:NRDE family protein [Ferrovum sp. PN-J185]KXW56291.1 hypothetical protein FV185_02390 [Ferrovum sp. PN-J185]MCC6069015.1 NRDE family protein [Ferrovum sp. PN-J185]MDE1891005.1 NRDE family protein [Betaproteobacteria bacterium]MDE2055683.1 NRDE family protein [Betaproteobacteria bacterium]